MVAEYCSIRRVRRMVLLYISVVLCVVLLILMLEIIHHGHTPAGPSIDAAMLPLLMALVVHPVEVWRR